MPTSARCTRSRQPRAACRLVPSPPTIATQKTSLLPASSAARTGTMVVKIAANSFATSLIGSQVKPLASRCSSGVSHSESNAISSRGRVADQILQFEPGPENVDRDARSPVCRQQNGGDDGCNQRHVDKATNSDRASRFDMTGNGFSAVTPDIERAEHREQQAGHEERSAAGDVAWSRRSRRH